MKKISYSIVILLFLIIGSAYIHKVQAGECSQNGTCRNAFEQYCSSGCPNTTGCRPSRGYSRDCCRVIIYNCGSYWSYGKVCQSSCTRGRNQ